MTSNPAKQLGIAKRVGSLEAGKDADFVLWSGDPLSTSSIALQTWVDGKKYFDRAADLAGRPALEKERAGARREGEEDDRGRAATARRSPQRGVEKAAGRAPSHPRTGRQPKRPP